MTEGTAAAGTRPTWIELSTPDPDASRTFYSKLFGWQIDVDPDPQYGGYGIAKIDGKDVAGIAPKQSPDQPTTWALYLATDDADELAKKVLAAGGTVVAPPFDVGAQGRMAVFQDPVGAFVSAWQATQMRGFQSNAPNSFGWAELNARGVEGAIPFYEQAFGWTPRRSDPGDGSPPYTEFQVAGESVAGATDMNPEAPADMPSYWTIYFDVDDVDRTYGKAVEAGGHEMLRPQDFPGGRFALVSDPQGAIFGLLRTTPG